MSDVVFGWPARARQPHAFPAQDTRRTVCGVARDEGRMAAFIPATLQGEPPHDLCPRCRAWIRESGARPVVDTPVEGTCPVCVGQAPLDGDGLVAAHGEWSWRGGVLTATDRPCAGAGEWPERET